MTGLRRQLSVLSACALLGACGASESDPGPDMASLDETRALEQAAEMLDQQRMATETETALEEAVAEDE